MFYQHSIEVTPLFIVTLLCAIVGVAQCSDSDPLSKTADFFGTVELLKHSSSDRHRPLQQHSPSTVINGATNYRLKKNLKLPSTLTGSGTAAAAENRQPVDVVDDLLKIDRNHLSSKQKVLLERIVERVARLRGSVFNSKTNDTVRAVDSHDNDTDDADADRQISIEPLFDDGADAARSNTNAFTSTSITSTARNPTTIVNYSEMYNGNTQQPQSEQSNGTNQSIGTVTVSPAGDGITLADLEKYRKYNKVDMSNSSSSLMMMANYTDVLLGNISTVSIVDSLSAENIPQHEIYEGRHPAVAPTLSDKVSTLSYTYVL